MNLIFWINIYLLVCVIVFIYGIRMKGNRYYIVFREFIFYKDINKYWNIFSKKLLEY